MYIKTFFKSVLTLTLLIGLISFSASAADGVVITSTSYKIDATGGKIKMGSNTMYLYGNKIFVKQHDESGNGVSMIFDGNKNEVIVFMNDKEYMVFGEKELSVIKTQLKNMMSMMEQMKDQLPPEQRKQYEKQKAALNGEVPASSFKKTGGETINGWKSDKYTVTTDNVKVSDIYVADFSQFGVTKNDFKGIEKMMKFFQEQIGGLSNNFQMGSDASFMMMGGDNPAFETGIPVKVTSFADGQPSTDTVIDSVEKKSIDTKMFEIPSSMQKRDLMEMFQGGGMNR